MRRLSLQNAVALALLVGGALSAALLVYTKLRPVEINAGWWLAGIFFGTFAVCIARWWWHRATKIHAVTSIDNQLGLEDRITTAHALIARGGPDGAMQTALIEDAARRLSDARSNSVVRYSLPKWYGLTGIAMIALVVSLVVPARVVPLSPELETARADIQKAGEQLEESATQIEQTIPSESKSAMLAREQSELGRALRISSETRAQVLAKLSALEERIRNRRDELAATRADEVVALAERRLSTVARSEIGGSSKAGSDSVEENSIAVSSQKSEEGKLASGKAQDDGRQAGGDSTATAARPEGPDSTKKGSDSKTSERRGQIEGGSSGNRDSGADKTKPQQAEASKRSGQDPATRASGDKKEGVTEGGAAEDGESSLRRGSKEGDQRKSERGSGLSEASKLEGESGDLKGALQPPDKMAADRESSAEPTEEAKSDNQQTTTQLPSWLAEQAARSVGASLSKELLKRAEQLRAGEMTPEDIRRFRQAAEALAQDLSAIAQSEEFQESLRQLAQDVNPEQLARVARELAEQEDLKREFEAAARLMMENQQAKQTVAGLAQKVAEAGGDFQKQISRNRDVQGRQISIGEGRDRSGQKPSNVKRDYERAYGSARLEAKGREERITGRVQRSSGGEYLFLKTRPDSVAGRSSYSGAYPHYRRQAERAVERSQVPARMRSVVRDYFEAINPD